MNSSNSGRCPGSAQPAGLRMCATLSRPSPVLARPTYSSISFGGSPAAATWVGSPISSGMPASIPRQRLRYPGSYASSGGKHRE